MLEIFDSAALHGMTEGFAAVLYSPEMWLYTLLGVVMGMVVGVLPGFGPPAAMALLFPLVYVLPALPGISLLAGIFHGAKYGGAVTSIVLGIPGEADAVATLFEGHALAKAGKAKQALAVATFASFTGGMTATLGMVVLAPVLTALALALGSGGRLLLMVGALLLVTLLGQASPQSASQQGPHSTRAKSLLMVFLGLTLALVGLDPIFGTERLTLGNWYLINGVELTALLLGVFGLGDILDSLLPRRLPGRTATALDIPISAPSAAGKFSNEAGANPAHAVSFPASGHVDEFPRPLRCITAFFAALRGAVLGFATGLVPSGAGVTASFASYALEKRISPERRYFGKGVWAGLAGPEAANNAAAVASFAPLLLLGLPTNPITAALLGALAVGGIAPGPQLPSQQPIFYWGLIFSLALGNVLLLALGLGLARFWARLARLPYRLVWPCVLCLCLTGSWLGAGNLTGPLICIASALLSVALRRNGYPPAPLILAFVLGPRLETHLAQWLMAGW